MDIRYSTIKKKDRKGNDYKKFTNVFRVNGRIIKTEIAFSQKKLSELKAEAYCEIWRREQINKRYAKDLGLRPKEELEINFALQSYFNSRIPKGGLGGNTWSESTRKRTIVELDWWIDILKIKTVTDFDLNQVEEAIEERICKQGATKGQKVSGKMKNWSVGRLRSFTTWLFKRKFLKTDPLSAWENYKQIAKDPKRAFTQKEFKTLWGVLTQDKRICYGCAVITGLRRTEIYKLKVADVDWVNKGIKLSWEIEKNKKGSFFHLPDEYLIELSEYVKGQKPEDRLFRHLTHSHSSIFLRKDLKLAGIPFRTEKGKLVFHSFRKTFLTTLNIIGTDVKTTVTLGRHSEPKITYGTYVDSVPENEKKAINAVYNNLLSDTKIDSDTALIPQDFDPSVSLTNKGLQSLGYTESNSNSNIEPNKGKTRTSWDTQGIRGRLRDVLGPRQVESTNTQAGPKSEYRIDTASKIEEITKLLQHEDDNFVTSVLEGLKSRNQKLDILSTQKREVG